MAPPKKHKPYAGCETGGRPVKYTKEFIENEADLFLEWMKKPDSIWYKDFALERGYDPNLLSIWAKENNKFSGVYERSQAWQQSKLIKGGLLNDFNSTITKLVLANTCGWTDKQQATLSGDSANPLGFVLGQIDGKTKGLIEDAE